eukprot:jgi/Botrbrau1/14193/Bobra.182_3s0126.1
MGHLLGAFTSLTYLDLCISLPQDLPLLQCPGVISKLRELDVYGIWDPGSAAQGLLIGLAQTLAPATCLTSLALEVTIPAETAVQPSDSGLQLAHLLGACPSVRRLELRGDHIWIEDPEVLGQAVMEAQNLSAFCADVRNRLWRSLVPGIAQLTRLQALEHVPLDGEAAIDALAALTQLTSLSIRLRDEFEEWPHVPELTQLSSQSLMQSIA